MSFIKDTMHRWVNINVYVVVMKLEELEQERESLAASIEVSVKERFQQDMRLLEDQLHDKHRVCIRPSFRVDILPAFYVV